MKVSSIFAFIGALALIILAFFMGGTHISIPSINSNIFSVEKNVSVSVNVPGMIENKYYVYNSNITICPLEKYEIDLGNSMINVDSNITIHNFRGYLVLNNSINIYGTFDSIDGEKFSVKGKKIKSLNNLTFDKVIIEGLNSNLIFNDTVGSLKTQDLSLDMLDKYVVLKNFVGNMELTNETNINGVCSGVDIIGKNRIYIK